MNRSRRIKKLDLLYESLPKVQCKGLCQEACGPIAMSTLEIERMQEAVKGNLPEDTFPKCPMLNTDGQCSVYEVRPMICRLYGVAEEMQCPFGCEPERKVNAVEGFRLLESASEIGGAAVML